MIKKIIEILNEKIYLIKKELKNKTLTKCKTNKIFKIKTELTSILQIMDIIFMKKR
jgi:hypothetical protein